MNANNEIVVEQLIALLTQGNAHVTFDDSVKGLAFDHVRVKPNQVPYSIWQLAYHICIAQKDILEFSRSSSYISPAWPDAYWPSEDAPANEGEWQKLIAQIRNDRNGFIMLLTNADTDLYAPFDHGNGQNLLREAMLIADHTSYHTGQIILIRKLLNDWK